MTCACGAGHDHSVAPSIYETLDQANDRVGCLMMTPDFWEARARMWAAQARYLRHVPGHDALRGQAEEKAERCRERAEACRTRGAA